VTSGYKTKIDVSRNTGWKRCALNPGDTTKSALFLRFPCTQQ